MNHVFSLGKLRRGICGLFAYLKGIITNDIIEVTEHSLAMAEMTGAMAEPAFPPKFAIRIAV